MQLCDEHRHRDQPSVKSSTVVLKIGYSGFEECIGACEMVRTEEKGIKSYSRATCH